MGCSRNHIRIALANLVFIIFVREAIAAQSFSFGFKAGIGLTNTVDANYGDLSADRRYTIGPTAEVRLPHSFAVEASALYRRTGYDTGASLLDMFAFTKVRANSWEIPIVVKYHLRLKHSPVKFHVSCGYALRHLSGVSEVVHEFGRDPTGNTYDRTYNLSTTYLLFNNPTNGITAGGGLSFRMGFLRVSPEIHYTRWTGRPFLDAGSHGSFAQSAQNQLDLLVGLTF
jgi:hypothetical protein